MIVIRVEGNQASYRECGACCSQEDVKAIVVGNNSQTSSIPMCKCCRNVLRGLLNKEKKVR